CETRSTRSSRPGTGPRADRSTGSPSVPARRVVRRVVRREVRRRARRGLGLVARLDLGLIRNEQTSRPLAAKKKQEHRTEPEECVPDDRPAKEARSALKRPADEIAKDGQPDPAAGKREPQRHGPRRP